MPDSVLIRFAIVLLVLTALSCAQTTPGTGTPEVVNNEPAVKGGSVSLDWSTVVGANYAHKAGCESTIMQYLRLDGAGLPVPPDATSGANNLNCRWDVFAWNSFAALNWAVNTAVGKRGLPSSSETFLNNANAGAEVVWESFKEKRELFQDDPSTHWNDIQNGQEVKRFMKPGNLWNRFGGYCSADDKARAGTAASGPFAADKFHNQLDETAEVQSQALESLDDLCKGKTITGHMNNQPQCGINNQSVVGPRVWLGKATGDRPLYYEVKVNYDFFDYVMHPPRDMALPTADATLVTDEVAATNAMLNTIRLPWRSAAPPPNNSSNQHAVLNYGNDGCVPASGNPEDGVNGGSVPCRTGAVHMKAAWLKLTNAEIALDPPRYHTTTALYYQTPSTDKTCIAVDTFGLVGLHAIQRVKTEKSATKPANPGGVFVFATWEHRSILDHSYAHPQGFQYVNLLTNPLFGSTKAGAPFPALADALEVTRMVPTNGDPSAQTTCGLSAEQTCQVNNAVIAKLHTAGSVWANYRLVGTQFAPNDCLFVEGSAEAAQLATCRYDSLKGYGQPHFLANAVIETNQGLQHFLGLPPPQPRLQPYKWCKSSSANNSYCDNQGLREIGPNEKLVDTEFAFDRGAHNYDLQWQRHEHGWLPGLPWNRTAEWVFIQLRTTRWCGWRQSRHRKGRGHTRNVHRPIGPGTIAVDQRHRKIPSHHRT